MDHQQIGLSHPLIKQILAIRNNSAPNRYRQFVAEGLWEHNLVLSESIAIDAFCYCPELIRSDEARKRVGELADRARRAHLISAKTLERIAETGNPGGLISLARMPHWDPADFAFDRDAVVVVGDGIEIPGNLGTLIRSMEACAADLLVLTNRRTRMSHPKVLRGSQGMSLRVPHVEFAEPADAVAWLRGQGFRVLIADTDRSTNYRQVDYSGRIAIVVGSERYGVSAPWYSGAPERVGIPMLGRADSLNVSVSASILLFESAARRHRW